MAGVLISTHLSACTSVSPPQRNLLLKTEKEPEVSEEPRIELNISDVDYEARVPSLLVSAQGERRITWRTRDVYGAVVIEKHRSADPVEFPVWTDSKFRTLDRIGIFTWSKNLFSKVHEPFSITQNMRPFPWTQHIIEDGVHFASFEGQFMQSADGVLESDILPFTLSGEFGAAVLNTFGGAVLSVCKLGIPLLAGPFLAMDGDEAAQEALKSPFVMVACPVADAVVLAADTTVTGGTLALDVGKDTAVVAGDVVTMTGAAALDLAWKGMTLICDTGRAIGDAVYPSQIETVSRDLPDPLYDEWQEKERTEPVKLQDYDIVVTTESQEKHPIPMKASGSVTIDAAQFEGSSTGDVVRLQFCLVRREDGVQVTEPRKIIIDRQRLLEQLQPTSGPAGY